MSKRRAHLGISLVEVILAVALFGLFSTALIGLLVNSYGSAVQSEQLDKANRFAEEAIIAVRSIRREAWHALPSGTYGLQFTSGHWQLTSTPDTFENKYTRTVTVSDVCMSGQTIVDCSQSGSVVSPYRKRVVVSVNYVSATSVVNTVTVTTYLTNWQSLNWTQTDWSGGTGQTIWSGANRVATDDGNVVYNSDGTVTLKQNTTDSCGTKTWDMSNAGDYVFNSSKIDVSGGLASLKAQNPTISGGTTNPSIDTNATGWTYADWNQDAGEVNVTGARTATGGNPNGFLNINIPRGNTDQVGGYWRQPFTTTVAAPTASIKLDWRVNTFTAAAPNSLRVYVFIDTTTAEPVRGQEVWVSAPLTATSNWTTQTIDVTNKVITAGTYYVKIAVWADTGASLSGAYQLGFDNIQLQWSGTAATSYPSDKPTINPVSSFHAPHVAQWGGFTEAAVKNGGQVYYQLSDDNGATWKYWVTGGWAVAGAANYSTAAVVNTNISSFSTTTANVLFKAFLVGNGTQQVQLDSVSIKCAAVFEDPFDDPNLYTYDNSLIDVSGGEAKLKTQAPPTASGGITNSSFDTDTTGWTYVDWDQGADEVNATGARVATGGNPAGYVYVNLPAGTGDWVGGYWRQPFTITMANPTGTLTFDWSTITKTGNPQSLRIYVFIEPTTGAPTTTQNVVWVSPLITTTSGWTHQASINIGPYIATTGTHYLKIGIWGVTPQTGSTGPFRVAFDNVNLQWSAVGVGTLPTTRPSITGSGFTSPGGVGYWTSFIETAQKNGGQIYYQLSGDHGTTWKYWNGSAWVGAGATNYNTAAAVNTALPNFATTTKALNFKAFLVSNGTQDVRLSDVAIGYGESAGVAYAQSGMFESSAFNTGSQSSFNFLSWSETLPASSEDIKVQLATAPDNAGSPGAWSAWTGPTGAGSFYNSGALRALPLTAGYNGKQWMKYKVFLTGDGSQTPVFNDITVNYTP